MLTYQSQIPSRNYATVMYLQLDRDGLLRATPRVRLVVDDYPHSGSIKFAALDIRPAMRTAAAAADDVSSGTVLSTFGWGGDWGTCARRVRRIGWKSERGNGCDIFPFPHVRQVAVQG